MPQSIFQQLLDAVNGIKLDADSIQLDADTINLSTDQVETKLDTLHTDMGGPGTGVQAITGSGSGVLGLLRMIWDTLRGTLAVSAASLPLPTGAATSAIQTSILTKLGTTLLVESSGPPTITAMTFNADGTIATYTEKREQDGKTRTVTRTYTGVNGGWTQAIGAWA